MSIASYIDHTLLKQDATGAQIDQLCAEAAQYLFASVCVNPCWVSLCAQLLQGTEVAVCTVIGFPLGANTPAVKAFEAAEAIRQGATEVDMVLNVGALKDGNHALVQEDIAAVVAAAKGKALVKVILETCHRIFHRRRNRSRYRPDACRSGHRDGGQSLRRYP